MQLIGEYAGTAAQIGDQAAALEGSHACAGLDEACGAFRREDIVIMFGGMAVEESNFLLLVLCRHRDFSIHENISSKRTIDKLIRRGVPFLGRPSKETTAIDGDSLLFEGHNKDIPKNLAQD